MNAAVDREETGSPFFLFPFPSGEFPGDHDTEPVVSSFVDSLNCDTYAGHADPEAWYNLSPFSPAIGECDYSPQTSIDSASVYQESYSLTSLDEVTSTADIGDSSQSDQSTSGETVTSKLKSVLIARNKLKDKSSISASSDLLDSGSPVSYIHNYSSGNRKRKHNTQTDNQNNVYQGGNKYSQHSSLKFPPCFVCGGTASGLHYGVNSCEPCKGFFTRYLRRKEDEFYKCVKDGNCVITNKLRGNCSACRLQKCLRLGMSRKNSRLGRYSLSRRMETIIQVNELENNTIKETDVQRNPIFNTACEVLDTSNSSGDDNSLENRPTDDKRQKKIQYGSCKLKAASGYSNKLVKVLVEYMESIKPYGEDLITDKQIADKLKSTYESYKLKIEIFGNLKSIPKDEYFNLLNVYGIEIDKRMVFLKQSASEMMDIIERYCNFAKQVPNFKALSSRDQSNLLKSSRYDFFMILMHDGYMHDYQCFLAHNGVAFHREEVADKFFSRRLVLAVCDMYHRLQKLKLSREEKALLIAISLVFTDRCTLENPKLVEQIQISLTQLLQRQLESTCPSSALRRFTKIIDCLTIMRESSELYLKEYNQLCQDKYVIEEVPIMTELLFEDT